METSPSRGSAGVDGSSIAETAGYHNALAPDSRVLLDAIGVRAALYPTSCQRRRKLHGAKVILREFAWRAASLLTSLRRYIWDAGFQGVSVQHL